MPTYSQPAIPIATSVEPHCDLCSLPIRARETREGEFRFCCAGCRQVFLALTSATGVLPAGFRKTDLYQACVRAGIIPDGRDEDTEESAPPAQEFSTPPLELSFRLENMWCPACAWLVEEVLKRKRGVIDPRVSFLADTVRLKYFPHMVTPAEIASAVAKLGYSLRPSEDSGSGKTTEKALLLRLGISAILAMNGMMLSWTIYFGLFHDLGPVVVAYLSYPLLLITTPVVFYGGMPILKGAWTGLRLGRVSMDTLIAVSVLAAFLYSLIQMARGSVHLYFDTAAMLITIVLVGRYIELRARHRVFAGIGIEYLGTLKARLFTGGLERWVSADALRPGDSFLVRSGERVPLDGRITKGKAVVDQSVLTGEARPLSLGSEDEVAAGALLTDGEIEVAATRLANESSFRRIVDLVLEALEIKSAGEGFTDSVSRFFVPVLMTVTVFTAALLWVFRLPAEEILLRSLTMLLISCPCAIGIAVPLVKTVIVGLARKKGILIRNPEALERMAGIDTIVLDKTGTVTEGRYTLRHVISDEINERDLFPILAALERGSTHVLAREIVRYSAALGASAAEATQVEELEGLGITGLVNNNEIFIGNRRLISQCNTELPQSLNDQAIPWEQEGMTVVFFGWDGRAMGLLVLGDPIRPDARQLVAWLRRRNIRPLLLSGDGSKTTEAVALSLSLEESAGQMLPSDKVATVKALQAQGAKVVMVGDGVNDAAALAWADVGIALGGALNSMREASDLIITSGRLDTIKDAFDIAALSVKSVRQNITFAFVYNAVAIPVAAAGFLNPLVAVFAMFASSLTVIGNALRLSRK
jgi:heavy metal translocating P-type ATPase